MPLGNCGGWRAAQKAVRVFSSASACHNRIFFPTGCHHFPRSQACVLTAPEPGLLRQLVCTRLIAKICCRPLSARSPQARTSVSLPSAPVAAEKISSGTAEALGFLRSGSIRRRIFRRLITSDYADRNTNQPRENRRTQKETPSLKARKSEHDFDDAA